MMQARLTERIEPELVAIADVEMDQAIQARVFLDSDMVAEYETAMRDGDMFPPIIVFHDGESTWLADGFHRVVAANHAEKRWIWAEVRSGSRRDAMLYAAGANADHGLRRSNADKWRAVEMLLVDEEWGQWSDNEVARRCSVSPTFVGKVRSKLGDRDRPQYAPPPLDTIHVDSMSTKRTFIHPKTGKPTTMDTSNIGGNGHRPVAPKEPNYMPIWELEQGVQSWLDIQDAPDLSPIYFLEEAQKKGRAFDALLAHLDRFRRPRRKNDVLQAVNNVLEQFRQAEKRDAYTPHWQEINMRSDWTCAACQTWRPKNSGWGAYVDEPTGILICSRCKQRGVDISTLAREVPEVVEEVSQDTSNVLHSSESNEWYTPPDYVEAVRAVLGTIDLDPASCLLANKMVRAATVYTPEEDGMAQPWTGRVFLNPPYGKDGGESNQARWSHRLIEQYQAGNVKEAVLLVNATPGNRWWAPLWDFPICFVDHRIHFYNAEGQSNQATHSNAFVYLGNRPERFVRFFKRFGPIVMESIRDDA